MLAVDLLAQLEEAIAAYGEDLEVRLATQPAYPFEYSIKDTGALAVASPDDPGFEGMDPDGPAVAYIAEGEQLSYLPEDLGSFVWG